MTWIRPAGAVALLVFLAACAPDDAEDTADVAPAAEAAPAPAAPPAELTAAEAASLQAWNQDDPAALAMYFTENATAVENDTMRFNGRAEIQANWLANALPVLSNLQTQEVRWEPVGQDFRSAGRYTVTVTTPEGTSQGSGTYESMWTRDADGQWRVSSMTVRDDPAPAAATGQ